VNITHAVKEEVTGDKLKAIFKRQSELMSKYHDIELRSGLLQTEDCPVNLDDKRGQARLKDFAWRVTEEVGEALDSLHSGDKDHYYEELIDGLHFLTEMSILAGTSPEEIFKVVFEREVKSDEDILEVFVTRANQEQARFTDSSGPCLPCPSDIAFKVMNLVESLGMTCNCLKNKPWKQSNMVTDRNAFYQNLSITWKVYIALLSLELSAEEIVDVYLRKSQVNKFRQRSNY
jgi:dUTPase.